MANDVDDDEKKEFIGCSLDYSMGYYSPAESLNNISICQGGGEELAAGSGGGGVGAGDGDEANMQLVSGEWVSECVYAQVYMVFYGLSLTLR